MGVWSSCQSIGNIIGALMVNWFLAYGFEYSFFFISYCLMLISGKSHRFYSILSFSHDFLLRCQSPGRSWTSRRGCHSARFGQISFVTR